MRFSMASRLCLKTQGSIFILETVDFFLLGLADVCVMGEDTGRGGLRNGTGVLFFSCARLTESEESTLLQ
jgi:hypothetical protein